MIISIARDPPDLCVTCERNEKSKKDRDEEEKEKKDNRMKNSKDKTASKYTVVERTNNIYINHVHK